MSPDPFDLSGLNNSLSTPPLVVPKKTPHSFLGENSSLVNLENLVTKSSLTSTASVPVPPPGKWLNISIRSSTSFILLKNFILVRYASSPIAKPKPDTCPSLICNFMLMCCVSALANPFSTSPSVVRPPLRTPPYPSAQPLVPQANPFLS